MKLKVAVAASLIVYVGFVGSFFILDAIIEQVKKELVVDTDSTTLTQENTKNSATTSAVLTSQDVAKHSTEKDCWVIIDSAAYNVTTYLNMHPGGVNNISQYCGKDGSVGFNTKGSSLGASHSQLAKNILKNFYVSKIGEAVPSSTPPALNTEERISVPSSSSLNPSPKNNSSAQAKLTESDVAKHSTSGDCWIIITGNVYNVTSYLSLHPGGVSVIRSVCGKDATNVFANKGQGSGVSHSNYAKSLLGNYLIGKIGGSSVTALIQTAPTNAPTSAPNNNVASTVNNNTSTTLTSSEVANHASTSNCWVIIGGNVYNLTNYLSMHPGGVSEISRYCGQDGTNGFNSRGGGGSHSNNAKSQLNNYLLGALNATTTTGTNTSNGSTSTTPPNANNSVPDWVPSSVKEKYPNATYGKSSNEDDGRMEFKLYNNGSCREIKTNSSGNITSDKSC